VSYLNFVIELSALPAPMPAQARYRISVTSPIGETTVDVDSPFTASDIERYLAVLGRQQEGITRAQEAQTAREFGDRLFTFLIRNNEDVNAAYFASLERAGNNGLRIRLSLENAGDLAQLPWEYLRDPSREFLALSRSTPIVRYSPQLTLRRPLNITIPLRVLVMISTPKGLPELDVEGEWQRLNEATADLQRRGLLLLERLDSATLIALQRRLRANEYHIFHFIGHSDFNASTQQGVLVFEDEVDPDKARIITGEALGRELGEESTIRLVVMNSCHSARRPDGDALFGIASGLVARGVPAVVAMQFVISDAAAKAFAEEFYRAISESLPIDSAVSEARRAIANRVGTIEWATPVLYMRSDDGVLFTQTMTTAAVSRKTRFTRRDVIAGIGALLALTLLVGLLNGISPSIFRGTSATPTTAITPTPGNLPDLQVSAMRISPTTPRPGQIFRMSVTVTNVGTADSGAFSYGWDSSVNPPEQLLSYTSRVDNIPPGSSRNVTFPFSYGWWGAYSSQLRVDLDSEVQEIDERNNNKLFNVQLADEPFEIDFSLLPTNELVSPPYALGSDEFIPWNLLFSINEATRPDCADTSMQLVEVDGDIVLMPAAVAPLPADCETQALSITVLRRPASAVEVGLLPFVDGNASLNYFADVTGTVSVLSTVTPVTAGEAVVLTSIGSMAQQISRIDIRLSNQAVRLTSLTLSPPAG
jgi:hypothetical protein